MLNKGSVIRGRSKSWLLRETWLCTGSLEIKSLLNTFVNSAYFNLGKIALYSKEKGGPLSRLIREGTSVSMKKEFKNDA